jgi:hypothetical protein
MLKVEMQKWEKISSLLYRKSHINQHGKTIVTYHYKTKISKPCIVLEIDIPISRQLCGYRLIEKDIRDSIDFLKTYLTISNENDFPESKILLKALMRSIVITYGKCFAEASIRKIKLESEIISTKNKSTHKTLKEMRDEHVAHSSSNIYEDCKQIILLPPETKFRKGQVVPEVFSELRQLHDVNFLDDCLPLLEELQVHVKGKIDILSAKLGKVLETISPDAFYDLPKIKSKRIILTEKKIEKLQHTGSSYM